MNLRGQKIHRRRWSKRVERDSKECCSEYRQIYENLAKGKVEKKSSEKVRINNENKVEFANISSDEDNRVCAN